MVTFKNALRNLYINHVFGMAGIKYFQPNISFLTEEDIVKAYELVDRIVTKINWGDALEETPEIKRYIDLVNQIKEEDVDKFFEDVYKHFNIDVE